MFCSYQQQQQLTITKIFIDLTMWILNFFFKLLEKKTFSSHHYHYHYYYTREIIGSR